MQLTLADIFRPKEQTTGLIYDILLILAGSAFIALTAQVSFNIGPVPITGQTFGVLLTAALLGSKRGLAAVAAYLIEGAFMNLPVFASATFGAAVLAGPTGGYLLGFLPAAFVVGWLAERGWDRSFGKTVVAMILGNLIIYAIGAPPSRYARRLGKHDALGRHSLHPRRHDQNLSLCHSPPLWLAIDEISTKHRRG